jgi:hypothetical protein
MVREGKATLSFAVRLIESQCGRVRAVDGFPVHLWGGRVSIRERTSNKEDMGKRWAHHVLLRALAAFIMLPSEILLP